MCDFVITICERHKKNNREVNEWVSGEAQSKITFYVRTNKCKNSHWNVHAPFILFSSSSSLLIISLKTRNFSLLTQKIRHGNKKRERKIIHFVLWSYSGWICLSIDFNLIFNCPTASEKKHRAPERERERRAPSTKINRKDKRKINKRSF